MLFPFLTPRIKVKGLPSACSYIVEVAAENILPMSFTYCG